MTNNAAIYGPPSHTLTGLSIHLMEVADGAWTITAAGHARTAKSALWYLTDVTKVDQQDYQHLVVGQVLGQLVGDFLRDRPGTEARARFVASGGLYEQMELW